MTHVTKITTNTHSFLGGMTASISRGLKQLVNTVKNAICSIFRFLLPWFFSKKETTQTTPTKKVALTVETPATKSTTQIASTALPKAAPSPAPVVALPPPSLKVDERTESPQSSASDPEIVQLTGPGTVVVLPDPSLGSDDEVINQIQKDMAAHGTMQQVQQDDSDEDPVIVSPPGPQGIPGHVEPNETDELTRQVRRILEMPTLARTELLDDRFPIVSPRSEPKVVHGPKTSDLELKQALAILYMGTPLIYDKLSKGEPLTTQFLENLFKEAKIPTEKNSEPAGFERVTIKGFRLLVDTIDVLASSLKTQADQYPLLVAVLSETGFEKSSKIYGVFSHKNEEGKHWIYLLDLYGKENKNLMSWRPFKNIKEFTEYFAPGTYSLIAMTKKRG